MASEQRYEEYLSYLYDLANYKYSDCPEIDTLIQETMLSFLIKQNSGDTVEHPKGFLSAILHNKYNDWLRSKYRNRIVSLGDIPDMLISNTEEDDPAEEYTVVRREIGRLIAIYREVTVRHYVHGHSVEQIAHDLCIPKGTVLSRLSAARHQIKERIDRMQEYSSLSYEPKEIRLSISGNFGLGHEPFSLLSSNIEPNILITAYDHPTSVRAIADALGIPCPYIEPLINKLIDGELMGVTSGGLVYTRCFLQGYKDSFGDIPAQNAIASRHASAIADIVVKYTTPLMNRPLIAAMNDKQKATLLLFVTLQSLIKATADIDPNAATSPPERPNAGRWLASGTVITLNDPRNERYETSGPLYIAYDKAHTGRDADCLMYDYHSVFGATHPRYKTFPYSCSLSTILRFYASFFMPDVKADVPKIYDLIPEFEKLHIIARDETGEIHADIPALTFEEEGRYWMPAKKQIAAALRDLLHDDLKTFLNNQPPNRIPKHIDKAEFFRHAGALGAYIPAQLLALVNSGAFPYPVVVGETPIIVLMYRG